MKETGTSRQPGRWVRVLLFVSLAVNLAVAGLIAGFIWNGPPKPHGDRNDPVLPYTRAFDEDQQRDLRRALRRSFVRDGAGVRAGYLADYETALDLLRTEPFDEERVSELLKRQAARGDEVRRRGQDILSAYLSSMTPEARKAYADRLEAEVEKMRQRGFRNKSREPRDARPPIDRD